MMLVLFGAVREHLPFCLRIDTEKWLRCQPALKATAWALDGPN